jgi:hemerythrin-like domain-containing protein
MGVLRNITRKHARVDAHITAIQHLLEQHDSVGEDTLVQLGDRTQTVRSLLDDLLEAKERELFPHAERVFGDTLEEISEMSEGRDEMLQNFDAFAELVNEEDRDIPSLRERFETFCETFEKHTDAQRAFFSLYSTILYPAGGSPD